MRFMSQNPVNPLEDSRDSLKTCTEFKALEENSLVNTVHLLTGPSVFDCLDSLIGPSGLLLVVPNQLSIDWIPVSDCLES
jgi:hypothetical protein